MRKNGLMFGDFLRQKRQKANITLRLFAQMLGLSAPYVSDLENSNRYPPDSKILEKMIEILKLNPAEQEEFYDLAGEGRNEVAPDLTKYINENKMVRTALRRVKGKATPEDWQRFIEIVEGKDKV